MDDVLLNMPPAKILDISFAIAALCAAVAVMAVAFFVENMTLTKGLVAALLAGGAAFIRYKTAIDTRAYKPDTFTLSVNRAGELVLDYT